MSNVVVAVLIFLISRLLYNDCTNDINDWFKGLPVLYVKSES